MLSKTILSLLAAAVSTVAASNKVALYWGQNGAGGQERLSYYCQESDVDVVLLSFLNDFPDPTNVNFANQCGATFASGLLHCPQIGEDIKACQASGKKVLLSLGGGIGKYGFANTDDATKFADTLWNKFGKGQGDDERPFDDAVVDGFDFDIEIGENTGYPELASSLRNKFGEDSSKQYYLSASPQCPYPDTKVGTLLANVPVDYAFIQFYNNYCSVDGQFNYDTWSNFAKSAPNPNMELFVGVPATGNVNGYVDIEKLSETINQIKCDPHFGGVSLWDASGAWINTNSNGENFVVQVKNALNANTCPQSSTDSPQTSTDSPQTTADSPQSTTVSETSEDQTPAPQTTEDVVPTSSVDAGPSGYYNSTVVANPSSSAVVANPPSSAVAPITTVAHGQAGFSTVTDIGTTVVTITSCKENKCTEVPVTTGVVCVTDVSTVYTTYCPLTASAVVVPIHHKPAETETPAAPGAKQSSAPAPVAPAAKQSSAPAPAPSPVAPAAKQSSAPAPSPVAPVAKQPSAPAPASSTWVAAIPTPVGPQVNVETSVSASIVSDSTEYTTILKTSTLLPQVSAPSAESTPSQVVAYEGAAASNSVALWFTAPLLLAAVALF
ncbi:CHT2 [Candida oxycetoniae]|uniref:chitinase n=1 Tax=Candida oxycetoniae TaxID=497107 RepID=A0AAI9WWK4_9ASCO|nr:CHT2 [Candida oxycetoniae]KAI3403262.2 CHT2 [Candida oxycetoniae]